MNNELEREAQRLGLWDKPRAKLELFWRAAQRAARAQGVTVPMKRIAEKKLEQMGATVHGVLAKNEAGAWVAVSEAGRVMWLDNFEGQYSSAQPEQPSAGVVPEGWKLVPVMPTDNMLDAGMSDRDRQHPANAKRYLAHVYGAMLAATPTTQPPATGAGVDAFGVIDIDGTIIYTSGVDKNLPKDRAERAAAHFCHEHINDAITDDIKGAGKWVVRQLTIGATKSAINGVGMPSRDDLIQCLLATHGQSEGVTADAILSMLTAAPTAPAVQGGEVPVYEYKAEGFDDPDTEYMIYEKGTPFCVGTACSKEVAQAFCSTHPHNGEQGGDCDCCGYPGHDLPKYRKLLQDVRPPAQGEWVRCPKGWLDEARRDFRGGDSADHYNLLRDLLAANPQPQESGGSGDE